MRQELLEVTDASSVNYCFKDRFDEHWRTDIQIWTDKPTPLTHPSTASTVQLYCSKLVGPISASKVNVSEVRTYQISIQ